MLADHFILLGCKYAIGECVWLLGEDFIHRGIWSTCYWSFKCQTQTIIKGENLRNNLGYHSESANSCGLSAEHASQLSSPGAKSSKLQTFIKVSFSESLVRWFTVKHDLAPWWKGEEEILSLMLADLRRVGAPKKKSRQTKTADWHLNTETERRQDTTADFLSPRSSSRLRPISSHLTWLHGLHLYILTAPLPVSVFL